MNFRSTLVSVILPVYNEEEFLRPCLDSLLAQSLGDIEIICIDDGSTDTSLEILREYAEKDRRLLILSQENKGAGAARNIGMEKASGAYLSFLDSDDFFEADMLKKLWCAAEQHQADITICRVDQYDSTRGMYRENNWSIMPWMLPKNPFSPDDIPEKIFNIGCGWAWDKLYRKDFVERCGIRFQEQRTTNDMFFVYSLYTKAQTIYVLDQVLAHQRINIKTSLSATRERSFDNFYRALFKLKEWLEQNNIYEKYRRSFVNWALNFSLWNINTLALKMGKTLREKCRKEYFPVLDIPDHPEDYYYNRNEYERMKAIMENNVKISVIIPVYNAERYLNQCLDSLFAQTFQNFEVLAVDDGSQDASPFILQTYAEREYRLHVVTKEHSNAGEARNIGLELASGEYLAFLDADDFVEPQFLEKAFHEAREKDADIVAFRCNQYDESASTFRECPWTLRTGKMPKHRPFSASDMVKKIFNMGSCTPWDKLFRRSFIVKNDICFQSNESCNDMLFTYSAQALADRISTIEDVLYHKRVKYLKYLAKDVEHMTSCFYKALKALQDFLIERNLYKTFKKSFINWAVDFSLFNLHNFHDIFRGLIRQQLKREWFASLDISGRQKSEFYSREQYEEMRNLVAERIEELRTVAENPSMQPKVSIIIPVSNISRHLRPCLDSVANQTLEEIEIIIVSDGSIENCLDIINEYAAKDPRVVVITGSDSSYGRAINLGLERATGKYIGIIKPDDFVDVRMFENLYKMAEQNNTDVTKCNFYRFTHDKEGNIQLDYIHVAHEKKNYGIKYSSKNNKEIFKYDMNTSNGIYRKDFIDKYHICYSKEQNTSFHDNEFWFLTTIFAEYIYFINQSFYFKRFDSHDYSVSNEDELSSIYQKNWSDVIKSWISTWEKYPQCAEGYVLGGMALKEFGEFYAAESLLQEGLKAFPRNIELYKEYSNIAIYRKDWDEAIRREKILRKCLGYPYAYLENNATYTSLAMLDSSVNIDNELETTKHDIIDIVMISDDAYVVPTCVAIQSIKDSKYNNSIYNIHILCSGLSGDSIYKFEQFKDENCNIDIISIDSNKIFDGYHTFDENSVCVASISALLKFIIPNVFPKLDKILYLDGDLIVKEDLSFLYQTNIDNYYLAAVIDSGIIYFHHTYAHMVEKYFNSGVMLMNLKKMRYDNTPEILMKKKKETSDSSFMDQNIFNIVFDGKYRNLPIRYNFLGVNLYRAYDKWTIEQINELYGTKYTDKKMLFEDPAIIHYSSKDKPWIVKDGAFASEWRSAYLHSPLQNDLFSTGILNNDKYGISVIIPCYNVSNYIDETLSSILDQTYKNIEIICLDDGSTDDTLDILKRYQDSNNNIFIYTDTNHGQGYQRNKGIQLAHGRYIHFMDSDDLLTKNCYELVYKNAIENDSDLIIFEGSSFYDNNNLESEYEVYKELYNRNNPYPATYSGDDLFCMIKSNGKDYIIQPCMYINKRDYLLNNNISFPESRMYEDNLFTLKVFASGAKNVKVMSNSFYKRRVRENSTMTYDRDPIDKIKAWILVINEAKEFLRTKNRDDSTYTYVCEAIVSMYRQLYIVYNGSEIFKMRIIGELSDAERQFIYESDYLVRG